MSRRDALDANADHLTRQLMIEVEAHVTDAVGITFRQSVRVTIRRPRWMPGPVYRALMRTIVVETGRIEVTA